MPTDNNLLPSWILYLRIWIYPFIQPVQGGLLHLFILSLHPPWEYKCIIRHPCQSSLQPVQAEFCRPYWLGGLERIRSDSPYLSAAIQLRCFSVLWHGYILLRWQKPDKIPNHHASCQVSSAHQIKCTWFCRLEPAVENPKLDTDGVVRLLLASSALFECAHCDACMPPLWQNEQQWL